MVIILSPLAWISPAVTPIALYAPHWLFWSLDRAHCDTKPFRAGLSTFLRSNHDDRSLGALQFDYEIAPAHSLKASLVPMYSLVPRTCAIGTSLTAIKGSLALLSQSRFVLQIGNQANLCACAPREISVLTEATLGHLRCGLADVPPQPNSPSAQCLEARGAAKYKYPTVHRCKSEEMSLREKRQPATRVRQAAPPCLIIR